jgi:hypothetical protein
MTISMGDVQDAIKAAVQGCNAFASAGAVTWVDEPRPAAKTFAILDILYEQTLQDRNCYVEDEDAPGTWYWRLSSLFYIRVQIRCESIYNTPNHDANVALHKIRSGLLNPALEMDSGVVVQHDESTYVHHISFAHEGRTISAYAFELGFRAVIDAPLDPATEEAEPNMQTVRFAETEVDTGADTTETLDQDVERPA